MYQYTCYTHTMYLYMIHIHTYIHIYSNIYYYIYLQVHVYVCICVHVCMYQRVGGLIGGGGGLIGGGGAYWGFYGSRFCVAPHDTARNLNETHSYCDIGHYCCEISQKFGRWSRIIFCRVSVRIGQSQLEWAVRLHF